MKNNKLDTISKEATKKSKDILNKSIKLKNEAELLLKEINCINNEKGYKITKK